jgi:hypothetical protein
MQRVKRSIAYGDVTRSELRPPPIHARLYDSLWRNLLNYDRDKRRRDNGKNGFSVSVNR